jgi:hypothetical protein
MAKALFINGKRNGYDTKQCGETLTVAELIDVLLEYDQSRLVYLINDKGYTYGSITEADLTIEEDYED